MLGELTVVIASILLYFNIRNLTAGSAADAFANAARVLRLERALSVSWEEAMQSAIVGSGALVTAANWIYIWGHWPVILGAGVGLFVFRRDRYYLLRNAMLVSALIGFLFFALFPVAPPRLTGLGLVDTVTDQSHAYRALQPPALTNQYAAFPSLHVGWNLLVGIVLIGSSRRVAIRLFGLLSPIAMSLAVIVTANHFVVDVVGGVVVVLVGLAVSHALARGGAATLEAREGPPVAVAERRRHSVPTVSRRAPRRQPARAAPRRGAARGRARRG